MCVQKKSAMEGARTPFDSRHYPGGLSMTDFDSVLSAPSRLVVAVQKWACLSRGTRKRIRTPPKASTAQPPKIHTHHHLIPPATRIPILSTLRLTWHVLARSLFPVKNSHATPESQATPKSCFDYSAEDLRKLPHEESARILGEQGVEALNRARVRKEAEEAAAKN